MKCTTTTLLLCSASLMVIVGCVDNSAPGAQPSISMSAGTHDSGPETSAESEAVSAEESPVGQGETIVDGTPSALTWSKTPTWHTPNDNDVYYGNTVIRHSGNDGLVFAASQHRTTVHRASDGAFVGIVEVPTGLTLSGDWSAMVVPAQEGAFSVQNPVTGELVSSVVAPDAPSSETWWARDVRTVLSTDGALAVTLICWDQPGDGPELMSVTGYAVDSGETVVHTTTAGGCGLSNWVNGPSLELTEDATGAVIAVGGAGDLWYVDLVTGDFTRTDLPTGATTVINPPLNDLAHWPLVRIAISPSGDEVAVVDRTATLRRFSLPGLVPQGAPVTAGAGAINIMSYGPSVESPLAWSPDGSLLAFVDAAGEPSLFDTVSETVVMTFERPKLTEPTGWSGPATPGYLSGLGFSADGTQLIASGEFGLMAWRANGVDDFPAEIGGAATVTVPSSVVSGEIFSAVVESQGLETTAVYSLVINGEHAWYWSSLGQPIDISFHDVGTVDIAVRVDDGLTTTVSDAVTVTVTAAQ